MIERWGWAPPEAEVRNKEDQAQVLHQAAIDARVSFEQGTAATRPLIRRVERLANLYVRAAAAEARAAADYQAAEATRRSKRKPT